MPEYVLSKVLGGAIIIGRREYALGAMLTPKKRHRFGITIRVLAVPAVIFNDSPGFRVPKGITGDTNGYRNGDTCAHRKIA